MPALMEKEEETPICKYCGGDISTERQSSPDWDGETCCIECEENLGLLMEDEDWDDEDDEWMFLDASQREDGE